MKESAPDKPTSPAGRCGISEASVTQDAQSLPRANGAGMFSARSHQSWAAVFRAATNYLPPSTIATLDPCQNSIQYSVFPPFIGVI